jgi:hypothetical protein
MIFLKNAYFDFIYKSVSNIYHYMKNWSIHDHECTQIFFNPSSDSLADPHGEANNRLSQFCERV